MDSRHAGFSGTLKQRKAADVRAGKDARAPNYPSPPQAPFLGAG